MKFIERAREVFKKAILLLPGDGIQVTYTDQFNEKHILLTESITKPTTVDTLAIFDVEDAEELGFKNRPIALLIGEKND